MTVAQPGLHQAEPAAHHTEMPLLDHLRELRNRVVVCAGAVVLGSLVCFLIWERILGWLLAPGRVDHPELKVVSFSPTDRIGVVFKIGMYGGLALASPIIIYELLAFIVPGLTTRERRMILPTVASTFAFLLSGMAFAYWIVLPKSLGFLLSFGSGTIENQIGIDSYLSFVLKSIFWTGLSFELPIVMAIIAWVGIATWRQMLKFWRYAIVLILILACFVVPTPDPVDQGIVAVPLFGLYLLGIALARIVGKRRPQAEVPGV